MYQAISIKAFSSVGFFSLQLEFFLRLKNWNSLIDTIQHQSDNS